MATHDALDAAPPSVIIPPPESTTDGHVEAFAAGAPAPRTMAHPHSAARATPNKDFIFGIPHDATLESIANANWVHKTSMAYLLPYEPVS
jgi:hypothetical protein